MYREQSQTDKRHKCICVVLPSADLTVHTIGAQEFAEITSPRAQIGLDHRVPVVSGELHLTYRIRHDILDLDTPWHNFVAIARSESVIRRA